MVIDHHASNEGWRYKLYKDTDSCAENVYYILDQAKLKKIMMISEMKPTAADYIYMGILHDTGCLFQSKDEYDGSDRIIGTSE